MKIVTVHYYITSIYREERLIKWGEYEGFKLESFWQFMKMTENALTVHKNHFLSFDSSRNWQKRLWQLIKLTAKALKVKQNDRKGFDS